MTVIVVTGTDTGVGKTVVTAAIAAGQLAHGRSVAVVKPAQTGLEAGQPGDLAEVVRLAGDVEVHEGVRLPQPLAPDTAARLAGAALPTLGQQRDLVEKVARGHEVTLVEGAGGVLVNLGDHWNVLDLAECVQHAGHRVVFVVVARAGLGTLNHSGLTVQAIQSRGLGVDGVVIGSWPRQPDLAAEQNLLDLPIVTGVPVLGRVPAEAVRLPVETFRSDATGWLPDLPLP